MKSKFFSLLCLTAPLWGEHLESTLEKETASLWHRKKIPPKQEEVPIIKEEFCQEGPQGTRVGMRHIEGKGIGYSEGYSTLEAFIAPQPNWSRYTPFLDLRGHVFNNGKWSFNTGAGLRVDLGSSVIGTYAYYDYRKTKHQNYQQASLGFEVLTRKWDFRLNGYLPFGHAKSHGYQTRFNHFAGHFAYLTYKVETALPGLDAEVGRHFAERKNFDFYAGIGPYYYKREKNGGIYGGKVRVAGNFLQHLGLELSASYDNLFHTIVQGEIALRLPLGPRSKTKKEPVHSCLETQTYAKRKVQPVHRNEIIVTEAIQKETVAMDPLTNQPYFFIFVDNTSHSLGTYESPYPSLTEAENASSPGDVIYVFSGDGTTAGMDAGILLKDNQLFLGSGTDQILTTTVGAVTIPAQTADMPHITNSPGTAAVELANNNTVSGFQIASPNGDACGIHGNEITNGTILNNIITGISNTTGGGIGGIGFGSSFSEGEIFGNFIIKNNQFFGLNGTNDIGIDIDLAGATNANLEISGNYFQDLGYGIDNDVGGEARLNFLVTNNHFQNFKNSDYAVGIYTSASETSSVKWRIINNTLIEIGSTTSVGAGIQMFGDGTGTAQILIEGNRFINSSPSAILCDPAGTSQITFDIKNNSVSNHGTVGIYFTPSVNGSWTGTVTNNDFTGCSNALLVDTNLFSSLGPGTLSFSNNTIENSTDNGVQMVILQSTIAHVDNNTINKGAVGFASISIETESSADLCLRLTQNNCDQSIELIRTTGTFDLEAASLTSNTPRPTLTGAITIVSDNTCQ